VTPHLRLRDPSYGARETPHMKRSLTKNHFDVIVAKTKLDPSLSPYSLRHSHISTLLAQGVGVLVVAARVGHSSPKMTLDTYGHTSVADRLAVVDVLDKLANS
jgi:integrase